MADSNSTAAGSKNEDESETIQRKDSFAAAPDATRLEKVRHSLKELEERRNGYLREKRVIGRVSSRRRDVGKELASIASRKVPFKWQRGNKIGEQLDQFNTNSSLPYPCYEAKYHSTKYFLFWGKCNKLLLHGLRSG